MLITLSVCQVNCLSFTSPKCLTHREIFIKLGNRTIYIFWQSFTYSNLTSPPTLFISTREYVVVHVLREACKICIARSVTLGIAAVQKSAEDTLIGAELVPKMLRLVYFKIKRAFRILRVLKKQSDKILYGFALL